MKQIAYSKTAVNALRRMPAPTSRRIRNKIEEYAADPLSQANNVKPLVARDAIRLRVGDWRVIMEDGIVLDLDIGPRGSVYD